MRLTILGLAIAHILTSKAVQATLIRNLQDEEQFGQQTPLDQEQQNQQGQLDFIFDGINDDDEDAPQQVADNLINAIQSEDLGPGGIANFGDIFKNFTGGSGSGGAGAGGGGMDFLKGIFGGNGGNGGGGNPFGGLIGGGNPLGALTNLFSPQKILKLTNLFGGG